VGLANGQTVQAPATAASAPAASAAAPAAAASSAEIIMVTVTANKRSESQRETAGTVSVLQGGTLEQLGAQDQEDALKLLPGVQINKGDPDRGMPTIRGVGTNVQSGDLGLLGATTGIYIEDVPFTDPHIFTATADLAPFDLERIEVLRGPQGALYGSSSMGGAIRYVFEKPNLDTFEASVLETTDKVSHGGAGYSVYGMLNAPIKTDTAALRVVAFDREDSGYITNLGTGDTRANELRQSGGRILGGLKINSDLKVTASFMTQLTRIADGSAVSPDYSQLQIDTPTPSTRSSQFDLGNLQVEWTLPGHVLTSNTGYWDKKVGEALDMTRELSGIGGFLDPSLPQISPVFENATRNSHNFSQEFRLASSGNQPFSYLGGLFYSQNYYNGNTRWFSPGVDAAFGSFASFVPDDNIGTELDKIKSTELAAFGTAAYRFSNGVSMEAGGRFFRDQEDNDEVGNFLGAFDANRNTSERNFTPKVSIKYEFAPQQVVYALASKGYRVGGSNIFSTAQPTYSPDSLWSYESGVHFSPSKDFQIDADVFYIDWTDAQVNSRDTTGFNVISNVGKATVKGIETSAQLVLTSDFKITGSAAYTEARTAQDFTSANFTNVPSGSELPGTAKLQANLQSNFYFQGPQETSGDFILIGTYVGNRKVAIDSAEIEPAYALLDSRVTISHGQWEAGLFLNNVFDKRGVTGAQINSGFGNPAFTDYYLTKPRTFGLTLRYDL
jgi:iron complex outermembrane receptor protein